MPEEAALALKKILLENNIHAQVRKGGVYIPYTGHHPRKLGFLEASLPLWITRVITQRKQQGVKLKHRTRFGSPKITTWRTVHFSKA